MTDPPLLSVGAILRLRQVRLINWLQDIFPEIAEQLGGSSPHNLTYTMRILRNWTLRSAFSNVVIEDRMAAVIHKECGRAPTIIPNWALSEHVADADTLRKAWGLVGHFMIGYSGNMGRARITCLP